MTEAIGYYPGAWVDHWFAEHGNNAPRRRPPRKRERPPNRDVRRLLSPPCIDCPQADDCAALELACSTYLKWCDGDLWRSNHVSREPSRELFLRLGE